MPLFGPPDVEKLKAKGDIEGLIKALEYKKGSEKDEDEVVRLKAARALGELRSSQAVPALLNAFNDRRSVCDEAIIALTAIGDARAIEPIIKKLDSYSQHEAERALIKFGPQAVNPLIGGLKNNAIKHKSATLLGEIGDRRAVEPLIERLREIDERGRVESKNVPTQYHNAEEIARRLALIKENISDAQVFPAKALAKLGDPRAVEPLIALLPSASPDLKQTVARALVKLGDVRACEALINLLTDPSDEVRSNAAWALGQIKDPRAIDSLVNTLKDWEARASAAKALDELGWKPESEEQTAWYLHATGQWNDMVKLGTPAVEPLISFLEHCNQENKKFACWWLGEFKDARAIQALLSFESNVQDDEEHAAVALAKIGEPAIMPLVQALEKGLPLRVLRALKYIGLPALEPLMAALMRPDHPDRENPAMALGWLDMKNKGLSVRPLLTLLRGAKQADREFIVKALDYAKWEPQIDEDSAYYWITKKEYGKCATVGLRGIELLMQVLADDNGANIRRIIEALGQSHQSGAVEPLMEVYRGCDIFGSKIAKNLYGKYGMEAEKGANIIREDVINALVEVGEPATGALLSLLREKNVEFRDQVLRGLARIGWKPTPDEHGACYWIAKGGSQWWEKCVAIGVPAVEPLCQILTEQNIDIDILRSAADALGQIGDGRAVEPLLRLVYRSSGDLQERAFRALERIGDASASDSFEGIILNEDGFISWHAAFPALYSIDAPRAMRAMVTHLSASGRPLRHHAAELLSSKGWKPSTLDEKIWFQIAIQNWEGCAAEGEAAIPALVTTLNDEDWGVRKGAARGLAQIYHHPGICEQAKTTILQCRATINKRHDDNQTNNWRCDVHTDTHQDTGFGIDFPL